MNRPYNLIGGITTSKRELSDLFVAWVVIAIVMTISTRGFGLGIFLGLVIAFCTVGVAFIIHELCHKVMAQRLGHEAEFEKFNLTLVLSLIFSFFGFTFIAPGAVVIRGLGITDSENGKISLAGPLSNLILGIVAIVIALFSTGFPKTLFVLTAYINCIIGLFNMIPFWILDGRKVFKWNPRLYTGVLLMFFLLYGSIKLMFNTW